MFATLLLGMAALSVWFWAQEAQPFLKEVKKVSDSSVNPVVKTVKIVAAAPKLFPIALDIGITFALTAGLALSSGILGAAVALTMSNAVSFFIMVETHKFTRREEPKPLLERAHDAADTLNAGLFGAAHQGLNKAEQLFRSVK